MQLGTDSCVHAVSAAGPWGSGQVCSVLQKLRSMACSRQGCPSGAGDTEVSVMALFLSSNLQVLMTSYHSAKKCYNSLTSVYRLNGFRSLVKKVL